MKKSLIVLLFLVPSVAFAHNRHTPQVPVTVPVSTIQAVDTDSTITSQSWFTQAYASGVRLYIVDGISWGSNCVVWNRVQPQFKLALAAGLKIGLYSRNPQCWAQAIKGAGSYASQLQFFALDVEGAGDGLPASKPITQAMINSIQALGIKPIIYSYQDAWQSVMKNANFASVPLWNSDQTSHPGTFGGWAVNTAVQYKFDANLNGVDVDLSYFNTNFLK